MTATPLTVTGNLTADPGLRYTPRGLAVARFTVAATPRRRDVRSGEWCDGDTLFCRCVCFGPLAENVAESTVKGTRVLVHGRLCQRRYTTADGVRRVSVELVVDDAAPALRFAVAAVTPADPATAAA